MTKTNFIRYLKTLNLTRQQKRTLRGQALSGDLEGAKKGLEKLSRGDLWTESGTARKITYRKLNTSINE